MSFKAHSFILYAQTSARGLDLAERKLRLSQKVHQPALVELMMRFQSCVGYFLSYYFVYDISSLLKLIAFTSYTILMRGKLGLAVNNDDDELSSNLIFLPFHLNHVDAHELS